MYWLEFFVSAVIIILAGVRLTVCADRISERFKFGKVWIGIVLLGVVTSLPEAIASLTAIITLRANDLAVGNLVGSNNFNLMLIVVMDVLYRKGSIAHAIKANASHKVSARFAGLLAFFVIFDIMFNGAFRNFHLGPLSVGGVLILISYFIGIKHLAAMGAGQVIMASGQDFSEEKDRPLSGVWIQLAVSAVLVTAGAIWLAKSADMVALETGLGRTFVGSLFLAVATSLPEMVVSLSAMKLGALDLAIGNIFGSNMVNMFIVSFCGLFHHGGPLLGSVAPTHMFTAALSILLTRIAVKGVFTDHRKMVFGVSWDSILMIFIFLIGTVFLYQMRAL